jgi:hypothetical protein
VFDDDELVEVEPPPGADGQRQAAAASGGSMVVETHTEYSAVARGSSHDNFAVGTGTPSPASYSSLTARTTAP